MNKAAALFYVNATINTYSSHSWFVDCISFSSCLAAALLKIKNVGPVIAYFTKFLFSFDYTLVKFMIYGVY